MLAAPYVLVAHLAALRWTRSIDSMSFLTVGSQIDEQYSSWDLTRVR